MATLPTGVGTGLLTANVFDIVGDTADADRNPDAVTIAGLKLRIEAEVPAIAVPGVKRIGIPRPREYSFNANFDMIDERSAVGVRLVATDNDPASPSWNYIATLTAPNMAPVRWKFTLATNQTLDLSSVKASPLIETHPAMPVEQGPPGVGIAYGGLPGQFLVKKSDSPFDTKWEDPPTGSDAGPRGYSAYEVAVQNGYVGTVTQWLASLKGNPGTPGTDGTDGTNGLSAYQIAVNGGYVGTEAQWIASLKGAKGDKGDDGDPATLFINDTSTSTQELWSASKINSLIISPRVRRIGTLPNCVVVGSSNAVAGTTWVETFCNSWGLTPRIFSIAGSAYSNTNNFLSQLQSATASSAFDNATVGMVIIADASNNVRSWGDAGQRYDITSDINATYAYAASNFPNARIIVLPVIWPADPTTQTTGVTGGYQRVWSESVREHAHMMRRSAASYGIEFIEDSWTWLTGMTGVMESSGGVHPNAAGYTEIAKWLSRYLRGESTTSVTYWTNVPYSNAININNSDRKLQVMREGWYTKIVGTIQTTATTSGGYTDFGTIPMGFRPIFSAELPMRQNGTVAGLASQVYENGVIRLWQNLATGTQLYVTGGWPNG